MQNFRPFQSKNVDVVDDRTDHFTLGTVVFDQLVFLLYLLCFLKPELFGQLLHLLHQCIAYGLCIPFQDFPDFSDAFHVLFVRLSADAWPFTILDMIFQTYLELSGCDVFRS